MSKSGDTLFFQNPVYIKSFAACVGKKEGEGPLGKCFDSVGRDNRFGQSTWERAESAMIETACNIALEKGGLVPEQIDLAMGGDLLNQCIATSYAMRQLNMPFLGLYGACSTMAEGLLIGAAMVSGGFAQMALASAASHFCSAERQYRFPLEYGGQRSPTAQWTATACGAVIMGDSKSAIRIKSATVGRVFDPGINDASNMGAAMAQSAYESLSTFFRDSGSKPGDFDLIITGDLASIGHSMVIKLFAADGIELGARYKDCGMMLYDEWQDVKAGASGCGCSAAVMCGHVLQAMESGVYKKVLFCGTGALMSPLSVNQGESIPGICHVISLEAEI